jgi:CRISPR-associated exonuclease Cas4
MEEEPYLALSALQHYAYCPRQYALIHIEQVWADNRFTAEGNILHERVDSGVAEQRRNMRYERGVSLISHQYKITGKMDLLEIETGDLPRYFPVEYKRGKPKLEDWDRIQLCAQALCIEEMRNTQVTEGAIWYWEVRRREPVIIDDALRTATIAAINGASSLLVKGTTPPPINEKKRCRACSLVDLCGPHTFVRDKTAVYVDQIFFERDEAAIGGDE